MTWLIIGIVLFLIELFVLKNSTYFQYVKVRCSTWSGWEYERTEEKPVKVRLWWILMLLIGNLPIMCILTFIIFWIIWISKAVDECERSPEKSYWRLHSKTIGKVIEFFNREV